MDSAVKMEDCDSENECTQHGLRSNIDKALEMLIQVTGISRERGERILLSTLSENCCDLQSWIEEAMVEIAIENEVNEECKELSLAMEASLNEASAVKQSQKEMVLLPMEDVLKVRFEPLNPPWPDQGPGAQSPITHAIVNLGHFSSNRRQYSEIVVDNNILLQIFPASSLLRVCGSFWGIIESDFELKSLVIHFMKLEDRCKKWWAQSEAYFEEKSLWFCSATNPVGTREISSSTWKKQISEYLAKEISNIESEAFAFPAEESGFIPDIFKCFSIPESSVISLLQDSE